MSEELKNIPGVDILLNHTQVKEDINNYGKELITYCIRNVLNRIRANVMKGESVPEIERIISEISAAALVVNSSSLKKVINATGIVLHTNLGRAPLGNVLITELSPILSGYSSLEYDLQTAKRGKRGGNITELIRFITDAEDAVVVNNNAAAVSLSLKTFAEGKEVIISRGELIEIGGSFRLPEIMSASGVVMREVGTTNRTRISDYENALNENTRVIFKANKSNFTVEGFTEETSVNDLVALAKKNNLILIYDIGSGLLKKLEDFPHLEEPDVKTSLKHGADLVTFSCDKLLGGPQAGIIAGNRNLVSIIASAPLMRTYRVSKLTLSLLDSVLKHYLNETDIKNKLPVYRMLNRTKDKLKSLAKKIQHELDENNISTKISESTAYCGGGTLPHLKIKSYSVLIPSPKKDKGFAQSIFNRLLKADTPILGILREGELHFDVLTLDEADIPYLVKTIRDVL